MDLFKKVDSSLFGVVKDYLKEAYYENLGLASNVKFVVPPAMTRCDYSTNVAMIFARALKKNPNLIAEDLAKKIEELHFVERVETVNGYINIVFKSSIWEEFLVDLIKNGESFGDGDAEGKVLLEFISANPTGPLHVGHCRGAILGLALSNLLKKAGYDVTKEYYINDYGVQINTLLKSIQFRYEQLFGLHEGEPVPEGCYPGDYLIKYAKQLKKQDKDKYLNLTEHEFYVALKKPAVNAMMDVIRADLKLLGLEYDSFVSETDIVNAKKIDTVIDFLKSQYAVVLDEAGKEQKLPYVYMGKLDAPIGGSANEEEQEEGRLSDGLQTLFRSTLFGDDKDRVLLRADGSSTYFASDVAYHKDKFDRGFNTMINLFGADHGGYVKRITSAVDAISNHKAKLEITLMQMVNLEKDGKPFKMSKRKGTFVLLSDVVKAIDVDELKLFMLSKSADTQMTFDLVKIKEASKDNLVYYIQYAYARTNSLLKNFATKFGYEYKYRDGDLESFVDSVPQVIKDMMVDMAKYPSLIKSSAERRAPNMVVDYLKDFSSRFHSIWGVGIRFVDTTNEKYSRAMMAFVNCVRCIIKNSLSCLGISPKEEMSRE